MYEENIFLMFINRRSYCLQMIEDCLIQICNLNYLFILIIHLYKDLIFFLYFSGFQEKE